MLLTLHYNPSKAVAPLRYATAVHSLPENEAISFCRIARLEGSIFHCDIFRFFLYP